MATEPQQLSMSPSDRRPLASRQWPSMRWLAGRLARTGITPNTISTLGMLAGIAAGAALASTPAVSTPVQRALFLAAAAFVQLRLLCNLIDGMVAVEGGKRSPLGDIFNEVPDRISDAGTLIGCGYALGSSPILGYIAACFAIFIAYLRAVGKGCGMNSDYSGPMAKQQRMFVVTVACVLMAALPTAWRPTFDPFIDARSPSIPFITLAIIIAGSVITVIRRLHHLETFLTSRSQHGPR